MADYPEHEKMRAVRDQADAIGNFLEWLTGYMGITLAKYDGDNRMQPTTHFETLMYEYFGIDRDKIEAERRQMLDEIRASNASLGPGIVGG